MAHGTAIGLWLQRCAPKTKGHVAIELSKGHILIGRCWMCVRFRKEQALEGCEKQELLPCFGLPHDEGIRLPYL